MADLDIYDVAFVAGGRERVVDTAVLVLVRSGRVRVHAPGQLATVDATRRNPVEAAVLDAMGVTGHRSIDTIRPAGMRSSTCRLSGLSVELRSGANVATRVASV